MHELTRHGDVVRIRFWSRIGAAAGYDASVYLARGLLVDTAYPRAAREVGRLVEELRPAAAFVTHWHEDHAGNVPLLASLGVPVVMSDATADILGRRPTIRLYRRVVWGRTPPLVTPVSSGAGPAALALLPAPGHSPDHHAVWDAERATLYSGDLFLGVKVRVAHPAERPRTLARTLREFAALRPERMFDTHRGPVADPAASLLAKAEWMEETIGAIESRFARGWSDVAIRRDLFGRESADGWLSGMEYARINFVRAVRAGG